VPELSIVVPTYRRRDALPRTLDALGRQSVGAEAFEVIVVDDPVDDDSEAVAAAIGADRRPFAVRQLHRAARGVSAARNAGWRAATSRLVMFIGDDILPTPRMVAEHLAWHRRHPAEHVGVLGRVEWAGELRVSPFMRWLERGIQFDYGALHEGEAPWTHFYTANVSLKRTMLERIGGFDEERFPFLYEDLDVGRRLSEQGFRLLYNPVALGEHLHATEIGEWRSRMAATARAERRWVSAYPDMPAWFHDLFAAAERRPRVPALPARLAARVPPGTPVVGRLARAVADLHFRQQLAPSFLEAWRADVGEPETQSSGRTQIA
jgi:glycosyltransferase involved in cell wall biosynthesis